MCPESSANSESKHPLFYQIKIRGHIDDQWSDWFEGMTIARLDSGETVLAGPVVDDASLHGLLKRVRDLGMPLISVNQVEPDHDDPKKKIKDEQL